MVIGALAFLLGTRIDCNGKKGNDKDLFPTDTIYLYKDKYVYDTIKVPYKEVKPQIIIYKERLKADTLWGIELKDTTIWIFTDTGHHSIDTIGFDTRFLTFKPKNPKIIKGRYLENTMSMELLDTTGNVQTYTYPWNLVKYNYTWEDGVLKAVPIKRGFLSKFKFRTNFSMGLGYNPFRNSSKLDLNGTIWYGKIGLSAYSSATIDMIPKKQSKKTRPIIDGGIGIRFDLK